MVRNFSAICKGLTIYSTSPQSLLEALVVPDEAVEAAKDADSQLLPTLLQHLPNIAATPWVIYYAVACACVNERAPFEVFRAWAERSPKYDADRASRLFHGLRRSHDGYAIGTLQKLVPNACSQFFRIADARYIRQSMEPTVDLQALGVAVEHYNEPFLRPLEAGLRAAPRPSKALKCKKLLRKGVRIAQIPAKLRKHIRRLNTRQEAAQRRAMPFKYKRPPIFVPARKHTLASEMPLKVRCQVARSRAMPFRFKRPPTVVRRALYEPPRKHIFVRSRCGTRKSCRCKELLERVKPSSVLILSPRVVFGRSMMHFKTVLPDLRVYSDLSHDELKTHRYLICQMESVWSVAEHYDCIIIDESESCLYQLSSTTVTRFEAVTEAFECVVRSSNLCIWADAFLSDRTLVVARELDPGTTAVLVHNTHVSDKRQAFCVGRYKQAKPKLLATAAGLAAQGDRNVVVCATDDLACDIATALGWPY